MINKQFFSSLIISQVIFDLQKCDNGLGMARRYWKIPSPMSGGEADGRGGYCPTPKDEEGIFQYLRAMPRPLTL